MPFSCRIPSFSTNLSRKRANKGSAEMRKIMNIKQIAGYKAAEYVKDTMILGLGNVSTVDYIYIAALPDNT